MKTQLAVALGLSVLATPAFATKARLEALGENVNGSFIVQDNRNIFYNAAHVNNFRDLVTFEAGDSDVASDSVTSSQAEGGIFRTMGNLVWGVHFGNQSNASRGFRQAAGVSGEAVREHNAVDLFVGGDAGVKWGANLFYSKTAKAGSDGADKQEAIRTRLGVIAGDIEGWANINIRNQAENQGGRELDGKLGYNVGAIYNFQGYRIFADYQSLEAESKGAAATGGNRDLEAKNIQVGVGRVARLNDRATLFTRLQYNNRTAENKFISLAGGGTFASTCSADSAIGCTDYSGASVPVVVGLEYDANSWLVLRASVAQTLWGTEDDKTNKRNFQDTTTVNAGASARFGEFALDTSVNNEGYGRVSAIYNF